MGVAIALFVVILVLTWMLFAIPTPSREPIVATSTPSETPSKPVTETPSTDLPLSARVTVSTPLPNTTVGNTFQAKGMAPGNWFFEASFPIMVRDKDANVIARTHASAIGEWMTTELVGFSSTIIIEGSYKGPATLILLKDNPSGLPEHDDAVEIPIVVQ